MKLPCDSVALGLTSSRYEDWTCEELLWDDWRMSFLVAFLSMEVGHTLRKGAWQMKYRLVLQLEKGCEDTPRPVKIHSLGHLTPHLPSCFCSMLVLSSSIPLPRIIGSRQQIPLPSTLEEEFSLVFAGFYLLQLHIHDPTTWYCHLLMPCCLPITKICLVDVWWWQIACDIADIQISRNTLRPKASPVLLLGHRRNGHQMQK